METRLLKLSDTGEKTVSLTCDGPSCNQSMVKLLGAKLDVHDLDPSFALPGHPNQKIHVILDDNLQSFNREKNEASVPVFYSDWTSVPVP